MRNVELRDKDGKLYGKIRGGRFLVIKRGGKHVTFDLSKQVNAVPQQTKVDKTR